MIRRPFVVLPVLLLVFLCSCAVPEVRVDVSSPIDFYSPVMSSVPGMPIDIAVTVTGNAEYAVAIELSTDNGGILEWGADMKVNYLGKSAAYGGGTRYWTPMSEDSGFINSAELEIKVTVSGNGFYSVTRRNAHINRNEDGMYVLEPGD